MISQQDLALLVLVAALSLSSGTVTKAQDATANWTGFSVYGGVAATKLDGDVSVTDTTEYELSTSCVQTADSDDAIGRCGGLLSPIFSLPIDFANKASSALNGDVGVTGTVGVGADFEPIPNIIAGAFADIDWSDTEASFSGGAASTYDEDFVHGLINIETTGTTSFTGKLEYDYSYTLGGRLGMLTLDRKALVYVLGGYTRLEASGNALVNNTVDVDIDLDLGFLGQHDLYNSQFAANGISVKLPDSYEGFTIGAGAQVKLTSSISLKLEGRYTDLGAESVSYSGLTSRDTVLKVHDRGTPDSGCSGVGHNCAYTLTKSAESAGKINIDPEIWSARIALSYSLN